MSELDDVSARGIRLHGLRQRKKELDRMIDSATCWGAFITVVNEERQEVERLIREMERG